MFFDAKHYIYKKTKTAPMKNILLPLLAGLALNSASAQSYTLTIRANPSNSSFRYIDNSPIEMYTHISGTSMVIADWTSGGGSYVWRSLLKFNLPTLPAGAVIDSALLSLYANPTSPSGNPGSPTWGTDNAVGIYRLTAAWDTGTISWATQPATTLTHGDTLAQSTSWVEDYTDVNITNMIKDSYALGNYGFLMRHLQETTHYNSMIFYSPEEYAADSNKAPRLVIYYRNPEAVSDLNAQHTTFDLYPNPVHGTVNVKVGESQEDGLSISVSDIVGRTMFAKSLDTRSSQTLSVDLNNYAKGCYIMTLKNGNGVLETRKLIVD